MGTVLQEIIYVALIVWLVPWGNCDSSEEVTEHGPYEPSLSSSEEWGRYTTAQDNCIYTDECKVFGTCSQLCEDLECSHKCSCVDGFKVDSASPSSCIPKDQNWKLLYATKTSEVGYLQHHANGTENRVRITPLNATYTRSRTVAVSYDARNNVAYWTDVSSYTEALYRKSLKEDGEVEIFADVGIQVPDGIAFDWFTGNVYFSDANLSYIGVCSNSSEPQTLCAVLLSYRLQKPRDIALHPNQGLMFWSDWGDTPAIWRAGMDGYSADPIVTGNLKWPNGLVLDYAQNRLYFVCAHYDKIETTRLDGTDRRVVVAIHHEPSMIKHAFGLDILGDRLFWSDWFQSDIKSANKFTGLSNKTHVNTHATHFCGVAIVHVANQPVNRTNPCEYARCSHICTIAHPNRTQPFVCRCPPGMSLDMANERTCEDSRYGQKLAVVYNSTLSTMRAGSIGRNVFDTEQLPIVTSVNAVVYNEVNGTLIISDPPSKSVYEYNLESKSIRTLHENVELTAMDLDPIGENLYFADEAKLTLEVLSLQTRAKAILDKNMMSPMNKIVDLLVVPRLGYMFVALLGPSIGEIHKIRMDGRNRVKIFGSEHDARQPSAISYDQEHDKILWLDRNRGGIYSLTPDGSSNTATTPPITGSPTDLLKIGTQLYVADQTRKLINHFVFGTSSARFITIANFSSTAVFKGKLVAIYKTFHSTLDTRRRHECSPLNNGCSHLCLSFGPGLMGECHCPDGLTLGSDRKTCVVPPPIVKCPPGQFVCEDDTCLLPRLVCDGIDDCLKGEDESNCTKAECPPEKFQCEGSDVCIPRHWLCDGETDCADASDERQNCPVVKKLKTTTTKATTPAGKSVIFRCPSGLFTCISAQCIPPTSICDGVIDCPEGDDEFNCPSQSQDATTAKAAFPTTAASRHHVIVSSRSETHFSISPYYAVSGVMIFIAVLVAIVAYRKMRVRRLELRGHSFGL